LTDLFLCAAPQLDYDGVEIVDTVFDFALQKAVQYQSARNRDAI
jgi:hypothetical protein